MQPFSYTLSSLQSEPCNSLFDLENTKKAAALPPHSLFQTDASSGPALKKLISAQLSSQGEHGVPACNNRRSLEERQNKLLAADPDRLSVLAKLCLEARCLNFNSTTREHRGETIRFIRQVVHSQLISTREIADEIGSDYMVKFVEMLGLLSPSASTLTWVHFALWGVSLMKCGTQKHIDAYLEDTDSLQIMGSLMMTELGHGSNVLGLQTTASYDPVTRGFFLNTPTLSASKVWAGGTVENSSHSVVFAQLILNGEPMGVHAFAIKIREKGCCTPGIMTCDLGRKVGLNGVDNGIVRFEQVWIPYDSLLDKYCSITPGGAYMAKEGCRDSHKQIYRLMCQFVRGRQIIAITAAASLKLLSTIFYCYPPVSIGKSLHRKLLVQKLSRAYALEFAKPIYLGKHVEDHIRASLAKAVFSDISMEAYREDIRWYDSRTTQRIRQVIEDYYRDCYATTIYEGVNAVLLQMGAQAVLKEVSQCYSRWMADMKRLRIAAFKTALKYAWNKNEPLYALKWHLMDVAKKIGAILNACKDQDEKFLKWSTECQADGIAVAEIYTQILIIEQFKKRAAELDLLEKTSAWSALCKIYEWDVCAKFIPGCKVPDLADDYQKLAEEVPNLTARLGPHVKYLDALMAPPENATPFDEQEANSRYYADLFKAAL